MTDAPNTSKPTGRPLWPKIVLGVFLLSFLGLGAWQVVARRYATQAPEPPKVGRPAAIAVLRVDPQAKQQESAEQSAPHSQPHRERAPLSEAEFWMRYECATHSRHQIEQKLISNFGSAFPELPEIYSTENPQVDPKIVRPVLQRILDAAKNAPAGRRPALLLAADAVAGRLAFPSVVPPSPDLQKQFDELAAQGLTFKYAELDDGWTYQSDLLWLLWREYASTEAGEDAFVLLLRRGWDTTSCCGQGSDNFRAVIREGEAFLAKRPQSPHHLDVVFLLAQAYETWWSLSLTPDANQEEGDPAPAAYREGAGAAREKAIAYYEEVLKAAPEGPEAKCSRQPLEMLQANQDTHQRRFYCYCD
jgi:hypothetical protein